jgi:hypothetical protein
MAPVTQSMDGRTLAGMRANTSIHWGGLNVRKEKNLKDSNMGCFRSLLSFSTAQRLVDSAGRRIL